MQVNLKMSQKNRTCKKWAFRGCWCALLVFGVTTSVAFAQIVSTGPSCVVALPATPIALSGCPVANGTPEQLYAVSTPTTKNANILASSAAAAAAILAQLDNPVFHHDQQPQAAGTGTSVQASSSAATGNSVQAASAASGSPVQSTSIPVPLQGLQPVSSSIQGLQPISATNPVVITSVEPVLTPFCQYEYQINGSGFGNSASSASLLVVSVVEMAETTTTPTSIKVAQSAAVTIVNWSDTQITVASLVDIAPNSPSPSIFDGDAFLIQTAGQSGSFCWGNCTISSPVSAGSD